jgi:hypothetical protein
MRDWIIEILHRFGIVKKETVYVTVGQGSESPHMDLSIGDFVWIGYYVGMIEDVAITVSGVVMVKIRSFKLMARGNDFEWFPFDFSGMRKATQEEVDRDFKYHQSIVERNSQKIISLKGKFDVKKTIASTVA